MVEPARIAFGGSVLDCAVLDGARAGAPSAPPAPPMQHAERSRGDERQQRCEARGWAVLTVAALHRAAVAVGGLAFVAAGATLWLG